MKSTKRLCFLLAVLMLTTALAGCGAQKKDDDILATVEGSPVYRWTYNVYMSSQLTAYQQYTGIDLTAAGYETEYQNYKEARLEDLIQEAALKNEARRRGLYELTDEEEAQLDQQYLDYYNESISTLMTQAGATDDAARRKAEKDFEAFLAQSSLTPERVREIMLDDYVLQKLTQELNEGQDTEISDEAVLAKYEAELETQTNAVAEDPLAFGSNTPACPIVYPAGYIRVQRILVAFDTIDREKIAASQANVSTALSELLAAISEFGEESVAAGTKQRALELALETHQAVTDAACANIQQKAEDILALAKDTHTKEEFIALGEQYTDDNRMSDYYLCADSDHVDTDFRDAALAMTEVNTVSDLVATGDGYCIIYLDEICEEGVRSFEEVKEEMRDQMELAQRAEDAKNWRSEYAQKAEDAGLIERFIDRL